MNHHQGKLEKVQVFIVSGVCGSGKTTIAERCSQHFNSYFIEGDELHPIENKEMMKKGQPLEDANRLPWLEEISKTIKLKCEINSNSTNNLNNKAIFVTCSALKRLYRQVIEDNLPSDEFNVIWIYLKINDREQLKRRMQMRKGHFMNANLIQSQFDALEEPDSKIEKNIIELGVETKSIDELVDELIELIRKLIF